MEWSKVKNIILLLLALLNGFLLVLVAMGQGESRRYQRSALDQAIQVLERSGIQVNAQALEDAQGMGELAVERDLDWEAGVAAALLGPDGEREDQGGGVYRYRSGRGEVSLRAGGALSARLAPAGQVQDPAGHAAGLLEAMGVQARQVGADLEQGTGTVRFCQLYQRLPLFPCQVVFTYRQGALTALEGTLLAVGRQEAGPQQVLTLPTALLRFWEGVLATGDVCSQIIAMEAGYLSAQSFSGTVTLTPAWRVRSDTADYYLDGVTGVLTRVG